MGMQLDWRFCEKCHVMFFDGFPQKGNCAAGGPHVAQGFMFALPHDIAPVPQSQNAWRYCQNCHSMFYDGFPQKGLCPSNGQGHVAQGFMFVLPHDVPPTGNAQDAWRFCQKCQALFYDGFPDKGRCDAGGGHVAQGFMFVLPHDVPTQLDFNFAPIVFSAGIAAGGNAHLTLRQDGSYEFSGHFHDSGSAAYNTALVYVVKDLVNQAYSFKHSGHIAGTFESGSRDDNWDPKAVNAAIADNWANIAGSPVWRAQANVNVDLASVLQTAEQAVGAVVDVVEVVSSILA
jgi:cytochrome c5